jgi:hypothetical protein
MFLDALLRVSNGQAFGAGAVSTDSIDLGNVSPIRQIGTGEPMGFGFAVTVAATGTNVLVEAISATDAALTTSVRVHGSVGGVIADFPAGSLHFCPINQGGNLIQRFIGIRTTQAAGTLSGTAWLTSHNLFSLLARAYAKGYTV